MPGTTILTATRSGPVTPPIPSTGRYFVAGITERGRTDAAVRVRSMADFESQLGTRQAYGAVYDDIRTYFEEGGGEAYVVRVVGGTATAGTKVLSDATPTPVLTVNAIGAGAWSSRVSVEVVAGSSAGLVTVRIYFDGALAETYTDLDSSPAIANALLASTYVRGVSTGTAVPVASATSALSAGNDQRASVVAADLITALNARAGAELGSGAVATPGYPAASVAAGLTAHAAATRRIALLAGGAADSQATITATTAALLAGTIAASGAAVLWPWVRIPISGNIIAAISPEGFAAAKRAVAIGEAGGPWLPPAGRRGLARFVLGPVTEITRAQGDALDAAHVSAIRTIAGTTRLYGWRSLSTDETNYALLTGRDVINVVSVEAEARLEDYVYRPIDGKGGLFSEVEAELIGILEPIKQAGGLYGRFDAETGEELDAGYSVDVGGTVNTPAVLASDEIRAEVALRISPVAVDLIVTIVKVGLNAGV